MSDSRVEDCFYSGNAVHGEPDYGLADTIVYVTDVLINAAYRNPHRKAVQSIYDGRDWIAWFSPESKWILLLISQDALE